jgi:hypothetical protein
MFCADIMTHRISILKIFDLFIYKRDSQIVSSIMRLFRRAVQVLTNQKFSSKDYVVGFKVMFLYK